MGAGGGDALFTAARYGVGVGTGGPLLAEPGRKGNGGALFDDSGGDGILPTTTGGRTAAGGCGR